METTTTTTLASIVVGDFAQPWSDHFAALPTEILILGGFIIALLAGILVAQVKRG